MLSVSFSRGALGTCQTGLILKILRGTLMFLFSNPNGILGSFRHAKRVGKQDREPRLYRCELVKLAMDGIFPSDLPLEYLLDRIKGTP